jgi:predicted XRE-type DNA-binding protein
MKKNDPRWNDTSRTPSCGNVFIDLGFEPAEAHVMLMRADLMIELEKLIVANGWTQPRVSKLMKRKWDEFSLDMLLTLATRIGLRTELRLAA